MKRIMTLAAVAAAGAAFAAVESDNIVGYQTPDVAANVSIGVDTFAPVTGTAFDINDITVAGKGLAAGQVQLQTLASDAATDRTFMWITTDEAADYEMTAAGWFDVDNWTPASEVTVEVGAGYLLMNDFGTGATVTYAGQVPSGATAIELPSNVSVSGNCTPVAIDINSAVVSGKGLAAGQVQLQTLASDAATDRTFMWITTDEAADYEMTAEGWFDVDNWAPAADVSFAAGEGFVIMNDFGTGATMTLPSAL